MSSKGGDVERIENVRTKSGGGFKRHCARRWWIYLIVTLAVILAVVLGIIFGALPAIAQKTINKSTLTVESIAITNPKGNSFTYAQNATVNGHVPVKSHLNPQRIAMFLEPAEGEDYYPFMYLNVSRLDLADEFPINVDNYDMEITNMTSFKEFTKIALGKDKFKLSLKSRPELVTGSLKNYVDYNKVVELKGFNALAGAKLYDAKVLNKTESDGTNMLAKLYVENKSTFTMEVGDLTANFAVEGLGSLGYGVAKDLTLFQGENHITIRGVLGPKFAGSELIAATMKMGGLNITVTGNNTQANGEHITWLESALNHLPLQVPLLAEGEKP